MGLALVKNVLPILYFLLFQIAGLSFSFAFLHKEKLTVKLLAGSVSGSVFLQWFPILFSFPFGFTVTSHFAAAFLSVFVLLLSIVAIRQRKLCTGLKSEIKAQEINYPFYLILFTYIIYAVLVFSGLELKNDAVYSSQATYGDMSMHLGFMTSIAEQKIFPPEYSILPGTKLCYPFLSDSISSSLYLLGGGLKLSYFLPMLFAGMQVMCGAYLFVFEWLQCKKKSLLTFILYFFCGGFGFIYFSPVGDKSNFTRIFTAFYNTPTNLTDKNIRWVNMIVDMLLPQRATLFGYAVLFTALLVLYRAAFSDGDKKLFIYAALFGGALPMIHTHSFFALGLVSVVWVTVWMLKNLEHKAKYAVKILFLIEFVFMLAYAEAVRAYDIRESKISLYILCSFVVVLVCFILYVLFTYIQKKGIGSVFGTWGIYLIVVLVLAVPQLLIWTLNQTGGDGFIRGYFNWANINDSYPVFYLKNLGITGILFALSLIFNKKPRAELYLPVLLIFTVAEMVVFQPNTYDNNKLLYVAFLFMCALSSDFIFNFADSLSKVDTKGDDVSKLKKLSANPIGYLIVCVVLVLGTASGLLTIGRELVSEYQLINPAQLKAAEYIKENTEPTDIILTATHHNNAVAIISGRNILCGSGSFLFFHGLNYGENQAAVRSIYENPVENSSLTEKYSVDYILVSDYENSSYAVDEDAISSLYPLVYSENNINIYKVN